MPGKSQELWTAADVLRTDREDRSPEQAAAVRAVLLRVERGLLTAQEGLSVLCALGLVGRDGDGRLVVPSVQGDAA